MVDLDSLVVGIVMCIATSIPSGLVALRVYIKVGCKGGSSSFIYKGFSKSIYISYVCHLPTPPAPCKHLRHRPSRKSERVLQHHIAASHIMVVAPISRVKEMKLKVQTIDTTKQETVSMNGLIKKGLINTRPVWDSMTLINFDNAPGNVIIIIEPV